jgi:hypothetical protein
MLLQQSGWIAEGILEFHGTPHQCLSLGSRVVSALTLCQHTVLSASASPIKHLD